MIASPDKVCAPSRRSLFADDGLAERTALKRPLSSPNGPQTLKAAGSCLNCVGPRCFWIMGSWCSRRSCPCDSRAPSCPSSEGASDGGRGRKRTLEGAAACRAIRHPRLEQWVTYKANGYTAICIDCGMIVSFMALVEEWERECQRSCNTFSLGAGVFNSDDELIDTE